MKMSFSHTWFAVAITCSSMLTTTFGGGMISIKFKHFENRLNRLPNGTCCDGWSSARNKCNTCEYSFTFCISDVNNEACSFKQLTTEVMSRSENYAFEEYLLLPPNGDKTTNPLKIPFTRWNGGMKFGVKAYDQDGLTSQLTCDLKQNIQINATRNGIKPSVTSVLLQGKLRIGYGTIPKLSADINVTCDPNFETPKCNDCMKNWYTANCTKYCKPRDDNLGHYTCSSTGDKQCLQGWKDPTKNCMEDINECTQRFLICKEKNECTIGVHNCHEKATCNNTAGSYTCACNTGYYGNGVTCTVSTCARGAHNCHNKATCTNTGGLISCTCSSGYHGTGVTCTEINECTIGTHNCHDNATCTNTDGSFSCQCKTGYDGTGVTCTEGTAPDEKMVSATPADYITIPAMIILIFILVIVIFLLLEVSFSAFNVL